MTTTRYEAGFSGSKKELADDKTAESPYDLSVLGTQAVERCHNLAVDPAIYLF